MLGWGALRALARVWLAEVAGAGHDTRHVHGGARRRERGGGLGAIERHVGLDAHKYKNAHQKNNVAARHGWRPGRLLISRGAAGCPGADRRHPAQRSRRMPRRRRPAGVSVCGATTACKDVQRNEGARGAAGAAAAAAAPT